MKYRITTALLLCVFLQAMALAVTVQASEDRETKMRRYEILYGTDEPEDIQPALATEEVSEAISELYSLTEAETVADTAKESETETVAETWYPDFEEDQLYLPEAITRIEDMELTDESSARFVETLRRMVLCQGTYIQTGSNDKVYKAEVEIFLKHGVPTCIIDYEGYVGFLEEAEVIVSSSDEYAFETWPIGKMAGFGQEFFIQFDEEHMHIIWGEGRVENDLKKHLGSMEELEPAKTPFIQTETYQIMVEKIDSFMGDMAHQIVYDEQEKTLSIYVVINEHGRQKALNNASALKDKWDALLESLKPLTETLSTALTVGTRDGLYDFTDAHCMLMVVDELNEKNTYYPQDIWAMIMDGEIQYDFLKDVPSDTGTSVTQFPSQGSVSQGSGSQGFDGGTGISEPSYSASSGERNALQKAKEYLNVMSFSYTGLISQLEYEGFTSSEARYGADNCGADWYEQASLKAKEYLKVMSFSYSGLVEQLEYEGFTHDQAVYGADCNY